MAKTVISGAWQEVIDLFTECKIQGKVTLAAPNKIIFKLKDPMGQEFFLSLTAHADITRNGDLLAMKEGFAMEAWTEPEGGKRT